MSLNVSSEIVMLAGKTKKFATNTTDGITAKDATIFIYIHIWERHGFFNFLISDRGRTFVNYFWD